MFQIPGRRADSLRIGRYTNFLDTTPTMTGRMLNGVADLFVVQWPEQLDVYKNAVDLGSIF